MTTYFISDLHLPPGASAGGASIQSPALAPGAAEFRPVLHRFLRGPAHRASALYLLGDLFEYWIGDDAGLKAYPEEVAALSALTRSGTPVYFQRGNRDFLVGVEFSRATGVQILPDPHPLLLAGRHALLSHGDLFCTADVRYQRWRRFSRNRAVQAVYRALPARLRERIAGGVRAQSDTDKRYKPEDIMDVSASAVTQAFADSGATLLIHGHTHRPAEHRYEIGGNPCQRVVLADWRPGRCEALRVDEAGWQRIALS